MKSPDFYDNKGWFFEGLRRSSKIFGNPRKSSKILGNLRIEGGNQSESFENLLKFIGWP